MDNGARKSAIPQPPQDCYRHSAAGAAANEQPAAATLKNAAASQRNAAASLECETASRPIVPPGRRADAFMGRRVAPRNREKAADAGFRRAVARCYSLKMSRMSATLSADMPPFCSRARSWAKRSASALSAVGRSEGSAAMALR